LTIPIIGGDPTSLRTSSPHTGESIMASDATTRTLRLLQSRLPAELLAGISGNAPNEIKELPVKWLTIFRKDGKGFAGAITRRLKVTEVSVVPHPHDPLKMEAKVVTEIDVEEGTHILFF